MLKKLLKFSIPILLSLFFSCTNKKNLTSLPKEDLKSAPSNNQPAETPTSSPQKSSTNMAESTQKEDIQNNINPVIIGNVITENQSSLAFLISGNISHIYVKAGDFVKKGQLLAALNDTQELIEKQEAEIKLKQKSLAVELGKQKLERVTEQFHAGIINKVNVDTENNTYHSILLDLAEAENNLKRKNHGLQMTKIFAPYEGVISQKNKSVGDFVTAGVTVFQITQNKNLEIYAEIPSIYLEKIHPNMQITFVPSANKEQKGTLRIAKVIPVLDKSSRTFAVYASIEAFSGPLNAGDFVEIQL